MPVLSTQPAAPAASADQRLWRPTPCGPPSWPPCASSPSSPWSAGRAPCARPRLSACPWSGPGTARAAPSCGARPAPSGLPRSCCVRGSRTSACAACTAGGVAQRPPRTRVHAATRPAMRRPGRPAAHRRVPPLVAPMLRLALACTSSLWPWRLAPGRGSLRQTVWPGAGSTGSVSPLPGQRAGQSVQVPACKAGGRHAQPRRAGQGAAGPGGPRGARSGQARQPGDRPARGGQSPWAAVEHHGGLPCRVARPALGPSRHGFHRLRCAGQSASQPQQHSGLPQREHQRLPR